MANAVDTSVRGTRIFILAVFGLSCTCSVDAEVVEGTGVAVITISRVVQISTFSPFAEIERAEIPIITVHGSVYAIAIDAAVGGAEVSIGTVFVRPFAFSFIA